jgi:hypothetical protein
VRAAGEEEPPLVVDDEGRDRRHRVRIVDESAGSALDGALALLELRPAARTPTPPCENAHAGTVLPCRLDTSLRP